MFFGLEMQIKEINPLDISSRNNRMPFHLCKWLKLTMHLHGQKHEKELSVDVEALLSYSPMPGSTNESAMKREHIRWTLS